MSSRIYRALVVGCSEYPEDPHTLQALLEPARDAEAVAAALTDAACGLHDTVNVQTMMDAPRDEILSAAEDLFQSAAPGDQVLLYFSGHGKLDLYGRLYLCANNTRSDKLVSSAISGDELARLAEATKAAAVVIVLDCCYSGNFKGGDPGEALAGRGRWVISSSRTGMLSSDAPSETELSAFTRHFVDALSAGTAADRDGDGFITVDDVAAYVSPRLEADTGQLVQFRWDGSGTVAISRADGDKQASGPAAQTVEALVHGDVLQVPPIPSAREPEDSPWNAERVASTSTEYSLMGTEDQIRGRLETLLQQGQILPIRQALRRAPREAAKFVEAGRIVDLVKLLDGLTCTYATGHELSHQDVPAWALNSFVRIYELGFEPSGLSRVPEPGINAVQPQALWLQIVLRVLALGGEQVRERNWEAVRALATQRPEGHDFRHYNNWIRHGVTEAARANLLQRTDESGVPQDASLIRLASEIAVRHECCDGGYPIEDARLIDQICQFDFLWCFLAVQTEDAFDLSQFYPSFSRFHTPRTEPIVERMIADSEFRAALLNVDDDHVASFIRGLDSYAGREGVRYNGWWGYSKPLIKDFLDSHPDTITH